MGDSHTGIPFQLDHDATPDRPLVPSHTREKGGCEKAHKCRFFPNRGQSKAIFVALASVTALLFLILICRSVQTRRDSWVLTRRLSNEGDLPHASLDLQSLCEEEEPEELNPTAPRTSASPPEAKKARVEAGGLPGGPSHSVDEDDLTSESEDVQPSTSEGRPRKRRASELSSGFVLIEDKHQTPSEEVPESPERSEQEFEVANALLSLQESFGKLTEPPTIVQEPSLASADPSVPPAPASVVSPTLASSIGEPQMPASSLIHLPLLVQPVQVILPLVIPLVLAEASHAFADPRLDVNHALASTGSASLQAPPLNQEGLSTSSAAIAAAAPCAGPREHPYYRVPRVDPRHRGKRRFEREAASSAAYAFANTYRQLSTMRALLAQEQLSPTQLNELARLTAEILSHIYYHERQPTWLEKPSNSTPILGRRYLLLDSAVAALQVLDEPVAGEWWERIMSVIPDDSLTIPFHSLARLQRSSPLLVDLMIKLHRALRTLKAGSRLLREETISLKRSLFFSPSAPRNFRNPRWDPWREDDKTNGDRS
ncbi:hypothetical protein Emed_003822 [Eimeria media]